MANEHLSTFKSSSLNSKDIQMFLKLLTLQVDLRNLFHPIHNQALIFIPVPA